MLKILTVLPHGICGAGVTRNSIDLTEYINSLDNTKINADCIANNDISFGLRSKSFDSIKTFSFLNDTDNLKKYIDAFDIIICTGAISKNRSTEEKINFINLLDYIKSKNKMLIYINLDHKKSALNCRMFAEKEYINMFEKFDLIFNYSHQNDFCKKIIEPANINVKTILCRGDKNIENIYGIDFDKIKSNYWKETTDKQYKTIKYLGRTNVYKGPYLVRDLHYKYFMNDGWITTIEGIDLLIGALVELYSEIKPDKIPRPDVNLTYIKQNKANISRIDNNQTVFERNSPAYVMPIFTNKNGLERLSKCQFGIELITFTGRNERFNKDVIENAMLEYVAVGCIPIFKKYWAEQFIIGGKTLISYGDNAGTIFLDENNPEEAMQLMNKLADNPTMYDEWRNKAFNFYKKYYDVKNIYSIMLKNILEIFKTIKK